MPTFHRIGERHLCRPRSERFYATQVIESIREDEPVGSWVVRVGPSEIRMSNEDFCTMFVTMDEPPSTAPTGNLSLAALEAAASRYRLDGSITDDSPATVPVAQDDDPSTEVTRDDAPLARRHPRRRK